jgi:hypothetical protein
LRSRLGYRKKVDPYSRSMLSIVRGQQLAKPERAAEIRARLRRKN